MPNAADYIDIQITNDKELAKLFDELLPAVQNKIVLNGMRDAAKIILQQAKSNFKSVQKNKSKTGYKNLNKSFTTEPMKRTFGLRVGIKNYKLKWVEFGTDDRYYKIGKKRFFRYRKSLINKDKDKHYTGKLQPTKFFFSAVEAKKDQANKYVSEAIIKSLEKVVQKYANTK